MKSILFSGSKLQAIVAVAMAALLCATEAVSAMSLNPGATSDLTHFGDIKTFWSLTKLGGGISVAIFAVLAIGIFLIVIQIYDLILDKVKGRALLAINYRSLSVQDINKLVNRSPNSLIARLYAVMLSIFHTTGNTRDFHDEIANYIRLQQDRFNTFRSRLSFLSDTAGALGLLGTVWGMFVTFFGGNLDSQRILNGMGLALVTTLIGLVVSIILNFCATEVFSVFNKRLELISAKADEFRLWLMAIVQQRHKKGGETPTGGGSSQKHAEHNAPAAAKRPPVPAFSLKAVSGFQHDGIIGQMLNEQITVFVETDMGKRVTDVPLTFEVAAGGGTVGTHHKILVVQTDENGMAKLPWTLGPEVGPQKLRVSVQNFEEERLEFTCFAQPHIPNLEAFGTEFGQNPSRKGIS